jgi:hypothetical protein
MYWKSAEKMAIFSLGKHAAALYPCRRRHAAAAALSSKLNCSSKKLENDKKRNLEPKHFSYFFSLATKNLFWEESVLL